MSFYRIFSVLSKYALNFCVAHLTSEMNDFARILGFYIQFTVTWKELEVDHCLRTVLCSIWAFLIPSRVYFYNEGSPCIGWRSGFWKGREKEFYNRLDHSQFFSFIGCKAILAMIGGMQHIVFIYCYKERLNFFNEGG